MANLLKRTLTCTGGSIDNVIGVSERARNMTPTSTTLTIVDELVRHTSASWESRRVGELAADHFRTADELHATPEYQRLHITLAERGLLG